MIVGIIGSGDVGKALARGFASRSHEVVIGSRDPHKLETFAKETKGVRAGTFEDAARSGELVVLATAYGAAKSAIELAGHDNFRGKIVIDVLNPLHFEEGKMPTLEIGCTTSAGEQTQSLLPDAKVVKAFNIIGNSLMVDPKLPGGPPTMFICGNDGGAKKKVAEIIESFGFQNEVIDLGAMEEARYLEALAMTWIHYAIKHKSYNHAFKLLR